MKKHQLFQKLEQTWTALKESYAGLSEIQLTEPGVMGEWSVKDILGHVTTWEEEALKYLPLILAGGRPPRYTPFGGIDGFNARMAEQKRDLALSEVMRQLEETHRRLLDYLHSVPEEHFAPETPFRHRLRLDTYSHYPLHARAIQEWNNGMYGAHGRLVSIGDTQLFIVEHGQGYPLLVLHGGPGLDHTMFGDYLNPLGDQFRLILVDQRSQGRSEPSPPQTWTLRQMAEDVGTLARALGLERYAVLGHSFGAFVALQHVVDFPGQAAQTIVSCGIPSARFLAHVQQSIASFEPEVLREQVRSSWEREQSAQTQEDVAALLHDQWPFHFADPRDPRIEDYRRRTAGSIYAPEVLRHFAVQDYGTIEVEDRLGSVPQPVLVLAGRYDRTCSVEAAEVMARGIPQAELVVFEHSGHMTFVEEQERYLATVRAFLRRHSG